MSMFHELMMKKRGIPSRYQEVEYIESTGTQYIDTGITVSLSHTYRFKGVVNWQDNTNRQLIGCQGYLYFGALNGFYQIAQAGSNTTNIPARLNEDDIFDITFDIPNGVANYTINSITSYNNITFSSTGNIYLFNITNLNFYCKCKLKPFQIYDNGVLVRNFIPVYDTLTQKYGMWESVQGKFYGNDGTGDFKGSIVGYTIVGSPTITDGVVSGFTTNDYVRTSQDWDTFADAETWKIHTRITTGESYSTTRATGIISGQGFQTGFGISNNGYLQAIIYLSDNSSFSLTTSFVIESNTSYDIELEKTQSQYIFRVKKTNTVTWEEKTNNSTLLVRNNAYNPNYLYFGNVNYFNVVFTGSIDMNETIIFVNNKLYFNGQQS